jgi:release factor glutamine methyltransferase
MNIRDALKEAIGRLNAASVPSHTLAAELLLMHALGRDRTWLYTHPDAELGAPTAEKYFDLVARRASGVPTQYLTGTQEFWGLDFEVTPAVLIPRPETEHVIEVVLERLGARPTATPPLRVVDVGTGSGCIAVALTHEFPHAEIDATDISPAALEVAQRNAARHKVDSRIHFHECNLLDIFLPRPGDARTSTPPRRMRFDAIVSNPPYIRRADAESLPLDVRRHEPEVALFAGDDGLAVYGPLIAQSAQLLRSGGLLALELGYDSLPGVCALLDKSAAWSDIRVTPDLAGIPRVISATRV